ncbi:hypothetical protein NEMBOFW57_004277 [Staphylotrichum longicolle]|uniref:Uncharacterized protein n=1 Tax=Staphylotrichum longicolle TaxID=669026 RepID=A0AAD4F6V0_9PEZI|nr:hypothetical protein NEMBOFW57_004277 [Staphylotrichum longicolle]
MGLTTILRGFNTPVAVPDRFLEANGVKPTFGYAPIYDFPALPGVDGPPLDPQSTYMGSRVGGGETGNLKRIFVPNRHGFTKSTHAYLKINLAADLPDQPPPRFRELRREVLGHATEEERVLLEVAGMQPDEEGKDPASLLFVVVTDEGRVHP